jgi:peptidoglycan-N-acetylglucosamine deacetylase
MPTYQRRFVTTSWDDGDPKDLKVAELLQSTDLTGTFYVPIHGFREQKTLDLRDLRALRANGFEIGAHSVSHRALPDLREPDLVREVQDCKQILEQSLGASVPMFCYPNGRYNSRVTRHVQRAGYAGARTTRMLSLRMRFQAFEMPTSMQAYPHSRLTYVRNQAKAKSVSGLLGQCTRLLRSETWVDLGKRMFDHVVEHGGVWHLYGHSWEIQELNLWTDLASLLNYVARHKDVRYVTNGALLSSTMS